MPPAQLIEWFNLVEKTSAHPEASQLPKGKTGGSKQYQLYDDNDDFVVGANIDGMSMSMSMGMSGGAAAAWSATQPFLATVLNAGWLTSLKSNDDDASDWAGARRVVSAELSIRDSGIAYSPGDSIGVCCPNPAYIVDNVMRRLQEAHSSSNGRELNAESKIIDTMTDEVVTLNELLTYRYVYIYICYIYSICK
jgi:sulfite reductase alpha subunit-like flavoprotein